MKKSILFLLAFLVIGCEEIPEDQLTTPVNSYQLTRIVAPTEFQYSQSNKNLTAVLEFSSVTGISSVYFDVYSPAGKQLNNARIQMKDDGDLKVGDLAANDKKYTGIFQFPDTNSGGQHKLYFYVEDPQKTVNAGVHFLTLTNFENSAPEISNLVMPDTVATGEQNTFTFTLKARDGNGADDIQRVFFTFTGATGEVVGIMHDDGDTIFGDAKAGDGIYSYKSYFTTEAKGQERTFTFQARDRGGALSNTITHKLYVK